MKLALGVLTPWLAHNRLLFLHLDGFCICSKFTAKKDWRELHPEPDSGPIYIKFLTTRNLGRG